MVDHKLKITLSHDMEFIKGIPIKYTYGHIYQTIFFVHGGTLHHKVSCKFSLKVIRNRTYNI